MCCDYWFMPNLKFGAWVSAFTPTVLCGEYVIVSLFSLQWRHTKCDDFSNHQPHDCLLNRLFRHRSKKTQRLRVTGLCEGNSPVTGEFPAQRASNAENVSIWWCHHIKEMVSVNLPLVQMCAHGDVLALWNWYHLKSYDILTVVILHAISCDIWARYNGTGL